MYAWATVRNLTASATAQIANAADIQSTDTRYMPLTTLLERMKNFIMSDYT